MVEDTSAAHGRIAQYIAQIDIAPRQVLVEAHVLQVALSEEERHGIDWRGLTRLEGRKITLEGSGFAETGTGEPSLTLQVDGRDMQSVIELIRRANKLTDACLAKDIRRQPSRSQDPNRPAAAVLGRHDDSNHDGSKRRVLGGRHRLDGATDHHR